MFSKKIIWLAVLSAYPLWADASSAKSSVKVHGKTISTENFVPAQDEPFSSASMDKKAASEDVKAVEPQTVKAETVKPESESKSIQGEAEQIQAFLSPASAPVASTISAAVNSTQIIQEKVVVKATSATQAVESVQLKQPVEPASAVKTIQPVQRVEVSRTEQPRLETSPVEKTGGPLRVNTKPTSQELQDREQYWQRRGRSDLAAKVRDQIKALQPGNEAVMAVAVPPAKVLTREVLKAEAPVVQKPVIEIAPKSVLPEIKPVPVKTDEPLRKEISAPVQVSAPVTAATHVAVPRLVPVPTSELAPISAPAPVLASAPVVLPIPVKTPVSPVKAAAHVSGTSKSDKIYRDASAATEPGVIQAKTDLDERNRYWDAHGRSDLVAQTAKPVMQDAKKPAEPVSRDVKRAANERSLKKNMTNSQSDSVENGIGFVSANPSKQELDERAEYWAARGRTDLSAKVQNQITEPKLDSPVRPIVTPVVRPVAPMRAVAAPVAAPVAERVRSVTRTTAGESDQAGSELPKPTSQELDDGAQYWEARGRSDLASQLRQKLQTLEPRRAIVARNAVQTPSIDVEKTKYNQNVAKTALEEALVKNPGSTQSRLDLAQIYQSAGEFNKARGLIDGVLAGSPDLPAALYSSAQLYAEQRLWRETLFTLEKISPVSRIDEMGKLQKTAWAHVQIDRADALVRQGNNREAELLLRQVAVELAVNYNQSEPPQTPTLWKRVTQKKAKH